MRTAEAIEILAKIKTKYERNKPEWYATVSKGEQEAFDKKNADKIEAFNMAISLMKCQSRLEKLQTISKDITDYISDQIAIMSSNEEQL